MSQFMGSFSDESDGVIPLAEEAQAPAAVPPSPQPVAVPAANRVIASDVQTVEQLARAYQAITEQLGKYIVGQTEVIEQVLTAMFCQGHAQH